MNQDAATHAIVAMVRPTLEAQTLGEDFDYAAFNHMVQDQSVTRDDLLLIIRLMLPEVIGLARRAGVMTVSTRDVPGFHGDTAWTRFDWLT